jgi:hypothetical protein
LTVSRVDDRIANMKLTLKIDAKDADAFAHLVKLAACHVALGGTELNTCHTSYGEVVMYPTVEDKPNTKSPASK